MSRYDVVVVVDRPNAMYVGSCRVATCRSECPYGQYRVSRQLGRLCGCEQIATGSISKIFLDSDRNHPRINHLSSPILDVCNNHVQLKSDKLMISQSCL